MAAGHPPPIVVPKDAAPSICETTGPPIGILSEPDYEDRTIDLAAGDRVVLYTDGITEAESEEGGYLGQDRLINNLRATRRVPLEDSVNSLMTRVTKWCGDGNPQDDITMLAFEVNA